MNTEKPFIFSNASNFYEFQIKFKFLRNFFRYIFHNKTKRNNFLDIFTKMFNYNENFIIALENRVKVIEIEIESLIEILGIKIN